MNMIDIRSARTCDCSEKHLSCISAREWMKNQIGVWDFTYSSRDIRDKSVHPAVFPIALPSRVIEQFTHKGELVLDPFVGTGTTLLAAQDLDRNAVGFDLNETYVKFAEERLHDGIKLFESEQIIVQDDARRIAEYLPSESVKLVVTSPPYANLLNRPRKNKSRRGGLRKNAQLNKIEQYSQDERDLGTLDADGFEKAISSIFSGIRPLVTPDAHVVINITDAWISGRREPLHINVVNAMRSAGFEFRNTIIWDRRNIVNRIGIFGWPSSYITMGTTFEYILDFVPTRV